MFLYRCCPLRWFCSRVLAKSMGNTQVTPTMPATPPLISLAGRLREDKATQTYEKTITKVPASAELHCTARTAFQNLQEPWSYPRRCFSSRTDGIRTWSAVAGPSLSVDVSAGVGRRRGEEGRTRREEAERAWESLGKARAERSWGLFI